MADKDDDDLDTEITGDGETDQDDAGDDAEETVESLKEKLAKTSAALKKANREAEKRRLAVKKTVPPARKGGATSDDDQEDALAAVEARATERVIRTEGAVAILAAGFQGDRAAARDLAKLLDTDGLELDDDGDVEGLDDAVDALKARFPRLFESDDTGTTPRRRKPGSVNAARGSVSRTPRDGGAPKTSAEKLGMMLRGGR